MARSRVFNASRGFYLNRAKAEHNVEVECTMEWTDDNTVVDVPLADAIERRKLIVAREDKMAEPLANHEIHGFRTMRAGSALAAAMMERRLLWAARNFAAGMPGW
jgi:hypothetical protein